MSTPKPSDCDHVLNSDDNITWYCEGGCEARNIEDPWTFGETKEHKHTWYPEDRAEGWSECSCGQTVLCDHREGFEADEIETPYMSFDGIGYHSHKGSYCVTCNYEDEPEEPEYEPEDYL